mmetsp:Transcript_56417/g.132317  ORF Transcript_56417/g.132317 Transcript_56417/m.132317 type:complete len:249 (-) Transcript_56417:8-754(-)
MVLKAIEVGVCFVTIGSLQLGQQHIVQVPHAHSQRRSICRICILLCRFRSLGVQFHFMLSDGIWKLSSSEPCCLVCSLCEAWARSSWGSSSPRFWLATRHHRWRSGSLCDRLNDASTQFERTGGSYHRGSSGIQLRRCAHNSSRHCRCSTWWVQPINEVRISHLACFCICQVLQEELELSYLGICGFRHENKSCNGHQLHLLQRSLPNHILMPEGSKKRPPLNIQGKRCSVRGHHVHACPLNSGVFSA